MSDKQPQTTAVLVKRLRRVAKWLDQMGDVHGRTTQGRAQRKARANTCWQSAARLEDLSLRYNDAVPDVDGLNDGL